MEDGGDRVHLLLPLERTIFWDFQTCQFKKTTTAKNSSHETENNRLQLNGVAKWGCCLEHKPHLGKVTLPLHSGSDRGVTQVHLKTNDKSLLCQALSKLPMNSCNLEESIKKCRWTTKVWKIAGGRCDQGQCSLTLSLRCHRATSSPKPRYHNLHPFGVKSDLVTFWKSVESSVALLRNMQVHTYIHTKFCTQFRGVKPIHRAINGKHSQLGLNSPFNC